MSKIVNIEKLDHFGRGVFFEDKICFVENVLPDELAEVSLLKDTKKYKLYHLDNLKSQSSHRVKPLCPFYQDCGGCHLQHMSYDDTLNFKLNKVKEILLKFKIEYQNIDIVKNPHPFYYRNKIELKIVNNKIGFYKKNSNDLINIDNCLIASNAINHFIKSLKSIKIDNASVIIKSNYNDELLINFKSSKKLNINRNMFSSELKIASILINDKVIYGEDYLMMKAHDYLFKCSYDAFFQINPYIYEKASHFIINIIPDNCVVADLYCGVGFLGILVAKKARKVYGIEIVENAIKDAITNAKINKIDNMYFMLGDVSKVFQKIQDKIDYLIVDPPRSGLDSHTITTIMNNDIPHIIYMSCDPNTLARDLQLLQKEYSIINVTCFDMFSYTYHCESIAVLDRR